MQVDQIPELVVVESLDLVLTQYPVKQPRNGPREWTCNPHDPLNDWTHVVRNLELAWPRAERLRNDFAEKKNCRHR